MDVTRRDFLKSSIAASTAAAVGLPLADFARAAVGSAEQDWQWDKGVCRFCGTGCGIMVATKDGRSTTFELTDAARDILRDDPARHVLAAAGSLTAAQRAEVAAGLRQIVYVLAPERIVLGGGVSKLPGLHEKVGAALLGQMSDYAVMAEHRSSFVVPPGLGDDAGVAGALALAMAAG